jgi:RNA polymerase sigma-70 factor, ECF subfamily
MKLDKHRDNASPSEAAERPTLRQLYQENLKPVWRFCRRMGIPVADLEDACQEVFLIAHRKLAEFEGRSSPRVWLFGICVRVAAARRRSSHHVHELVGERMPEAACPETASAHVEQSEARAVLDKMLDQLDETQRIVFVLHELEELPMPEIATLVDCPVQTAYSRLHAARKQLEATIARRLMLEEAS